jgi:type IV secretion system protein VirB9
VKIIIFILSIFLFSMPVNAARKAADGKVDPRIKVFTYSPRDVYQVNAHYGYSSHILFGEGEVIEHVSMGDSLAWYVIPNGNNLFLKPIENKANTNMTVLTNKRTYNFELRSYTAKSIKDPKLTFSAYFRYPQEELEAMLEKEKESLKKRQASLRRLNEEVVPKREISPEFWNFDYARKGSEDLAPLHVFDDGEFTYFHFPKGIDTPAIFLVDDQKKESLINFHVRGKYVVVQRVAKQFILRHSGIATCIFNEAYRDGLESSEVPQVGQKKFIKEKPDV